jgi:signal transduction histidine kinase
MILPEQNRNNGIFDRISSLKYAIDFSYGDTNYRIVYSIGQDIRILTYVLFGLLSFEMLLLIGNANKGFHVIKKTLKPLEDLTEKAKIINAEVSSMGSKAYDKYIKDLAGAISSIDANKLDKRITVDSSQNELKELASAINGMLHRINSSYQAQVRFVSDASHELRTPISVIQGYVNLLDRWGKDDPAVMQESIDAIKAEAENMKDLIEQLLFLARSDNDTINLQMDDFDCCDVVDEVVKETQMIDKSHSLEMDLNRPAYIHADRQLIKQAIRIFVDNSIKYTPNGNTIILRVEKKDNMVHIVVQDSGIGIHPKDLPHIFDRFYRSDESRARKTGGTGLGLSIAKWIIEKHDGYIEVLSRVNIGTRFTIVLPAKEVEEQKES